MTWFAVKKDLELRIGEIMAAAGYEARPSWNGRYGIIKCGNRGHESWNFEVHLSMDFNGNADAEFRSHNYSLTRNKFIDIETDEEIPFRKGSVRAGDTASTGHFLHCVRQEAQRWARHHRAYEERKARGDIQEHLQALIERDPENAAQVIADILNKHLAPYEIENLQGSVMEACIGTFEP